MTAHEFLDELKKIEYQKGIEDAIFFVICNVKRKIISPESLNELFLILMEDMTLIHMFTHISLLVETTLHNCVYLEERGKYFNTIKDIIKIMSPKNVNLILMGLEK